MLKLLSKKGDLVKTYKEFLEDVAPVSDAKDKKQQRKAKKKESEAKDKE